MNKNIEHLMHNLPDYITGELHDDGLRKEITDQINSDPLFKAEYEDMKNSFAFLGEATLSDPPGFYFNNLLPNINQKIDSLETKPAGLFSGWLYNALKFAIPALILVLGYYLYTQFTSTDSEEVLTDHKNEIIKENNPEPVKNEITSNTSKDTENNIIQENEKLKNETPVRRVDDAYVITENNGGSTALNISNENSDELEEILYDNASYPVAAEEIEEQAEELTLQEQNELLNYMQNAQL